VPTRQPGSLVLAAAAGDSSAGGKTPGNTWTARLNRVSNFASILCAIDCTVFPVLLALLPLANVLPGSAEWLHHAAHAVALWFVAPVGSSAVLFNASQHRKPLVALWGLSGVALVLLANLHLHVFPHAIEVFLHRRHSIINVCGCILLLSSQWYAHRISPCCDHGHGHGHGHSHSHDSA
jgi:hypothetical protein